MRIFYTAGHLQESVHAQLNQWAFIPTMGALHQGHLSLIHKAKEQGHKTVVSIFVNPTQFNNSEDLNKYPRTVFEDLIKLSQAGVDAVFLPAVTEIYPATHELQKVILGVEAQNLEGYFRPGHFEGVVMVLRRLFSMVKPGHVFFGQKDLQQCMVVRRLILEEFNHIKFNMIETIREDDGLAMSSRNVRLSADERKVACEIYRILEQLTTNDMSTDDLSYLVRVLATKGIQTEYLNYVTLPQLEVVSTRQEACAAVYAGYLGNVRLIDNVVFREII